MIKIPVTLETGGDGVLTPGRGFETSGSDPPRNAPNDWLDPMRREFFVCADRSTLGDATWNSKNNFFAWLSLKTSWSQKNRNLAIL